MFSHYNSPYNDMCPEKTETHAHNQTVLPQHEGNYTFKDDLLLTLRRYNFKNLLFTQFTCVKSDNTVKN